MHFHPLINTQILEELQLLSQDQPEFFEDLLLSYIEQIDVFEKEFVHCCQQLDVMQQKRLIHKFLGSSNTLGVVALSHYLDLLYQKISNNIPLTPQDLQKLQNFISQTRQALQKFLNNKS
ncbi:MAG: hypothetical protein RML72_02035 [Bacteroidia bacterium]|nr:hypothetical protein [Bacteroidia bacterium]